jgi:hypothetical protein
MAVDMGRMNAYALFFIGCGLMGIPALALFAILERRRGPVNG